jgi:hypothetical protein
MYPILCSVAAVAGFVLVGCSEPVHSQPEGNSLRTPEQNESKDPQTSDPVAGPKAVCFESQKRPGDLAWENDRIGFRIYGLASKSTGKVSSAPDIWCKKVRYPVVRKFYNQGKSYHKDWGEGLDFYSMGLACGAGGSGIWDGQKLHMPPLWKDYRILEDRGDKVVFELKLGPWKADGRELTETRKITLAEGENLYKARSVYEVLSGSEEKLTVGVGIGMLKDKGTFQADPKRGTLIYWSEESGKDGHVGIAVVVDPDQWQGTKDLGHSQIILLPAQPGEEVTYYAGACWSKGLDFSSLEQWQEYVTEFSKERFEKEE